MRGSTPSQRPAPARQRRTSGGVSLARPSRSADPAPGVSCPLPCGLLLIGVIIGYIAEVMRCADRLCSHFLRGRSQGPAKVIQSRRGQRFRRVFFSPWWGLPCWGVLLPCCRPPALFACRLRGGSVLHFLFPGVNSPGFIFLSSCARPALVCGVCVPSVSVYGVSRGPLWAVPVAVGLAYPAANAPAWGFLGRRGRSGSRRGRRRPGRVQRGQADFFRGSALIAPPRLPVVRLPAPKSLGQSRKVESRRGSARKSLLSGAPS